MFVGQLGASFIYFGQLLRWAHKRIVNNNNESVHREEQHAS